METETQDRVLITIYPCYNEFGNVCITTNWKYSVHQASIVVRIHFTCTWQLNVKLKLTRDFVNNHVALKKNNAPMGGRLKERQTKYWQLVISASVNYKVSLFNRIK